MIYQVKTISELHEIAGFEKPRHPLVSIIDYSKVKVANAPESGSYICDFYAVNFKKYCQFIYGKQLFDHQEGTLHCIAPGQIIKFDRQKETGSTEGWGLYFHPELIHGTGLGKKIHAFSFFTYEENEALHLSEKEKATLLSILSQLKLEYHTSLDHYSNELIVCFIELLLNYCNRFYDRQFITRSDQNHDVLIRFEKFMIQYYYSGEYKNQGIPSVKFCAEKMHLSSNYFSDLLKNETGKNAQEHIHFFLLEQAKKLLANANMSISEIGYELGFEHSQSFSRFFNKKTGVYPSDFRKSIIKNNLL